MVDNSLMNSGRSLRIALTPLLLSAFGLCSAQTATNTCSYAAGNQYTVSATCVFQTFNKPAAFTASMNPAGCSGANYDDAWGWFQATSTRTAITFDPAGAERPIIHVFTGACGSLTQVACFNGGANGRNAEVNIATTPGTDYMIRIQRHNTNNAMNGSICIRTALVNDECSSATVLPVLENCFMQTFTNDRATISGETPAPSCGGAFNSITASDVWFSFTPIGTGQVVIETVAGTLTDAVMQLYSGNCNGLVRVECDDDDGPGLMSRIDRTCNPLTPGQTYLLRVWGYGGGLGTFDLCVSEPTIYVPRFEDCEGSILICGDQQINNNAQDFGCTQDLSGTNRGCLLGNERQGSWYTFTPSASGTIEFTIIPTDNIDYDYALWGPLTTFACPPAAAPVRCSWAYPPAVPGFPAASAFHTGLRAGNVDVSEADSGPGVNGFTAPLDVIAGEVYILYIDNFDVTGQAFTLDWTLTNGCSLDCNVLPVELLTFGAEAFATHVELEWLTQTERNSSHFDVERSYDGEHFTTRGRVSAAGLSGSRIDYSWADEYPLTGVAYYRLRFVDRDGSFKFSNVVSVVFRSTSAKLIVHPNPALDNIAVELFQGPAGPAELLVMDASGRKVKQARIVLESGSVSISLPVHDLESGSYIVQVRVDGAAEVALGRFVKQ